MKHQRWNRRRIILASLLAGLPGIAKAGPIEARYQISIGGLSIGAATIGGQISAQSYRVALNAKLTGLAGALTSGAGAVQVSGSFQGDRPVSNGYALAANNSQISRTIRIGMAAGNVADVAIEPPFEPKPDRVPVLEHHRRAVADPVSALLMPARAQGDLLSPENCNRKIPVFDGVQRFDIDLSYVETKPINDPRRGYVGHVLVCRANYAPIAGHRPIPATTYMQQNRDMQVWLAPVAGSRALMPWRIQVKTQLGQLVIEAQTVSGLEMDATASIRR
ncbi:MAG: DUF3108 domain-containing protein [Beijerinckiaceae bacterium]